MKKQIIIVHGGDSFRTYKKYLSFLKNCQIDFNRYRAGKKDWKSTLGGALGKNFEVILPAMPNKSNAKYAEWKIWFEKFIPYLRPGMVFIGHSLGGLFLAKYLAENNFPKRIRAVFLIAAPYKAGDFTLPKTLKRLERREKIFLYHSKDDPVVPFGDFKKYQRHLKSAIARVFDTRGHFNQEKLPELVKDIRNLY